MFKEPAADNVVATHSIEDRLRVLAPDFAGVESTLRVPGEENQARRGLGDHFVVTAKLRCPHGTFEHLGRCFGLQAVGSHDSSHEQHLRQQGRAAETTGIPFEIDDHR